TGVHDTARFSLNDALPIFVHVDVVEVHRVRVFRQVGEGVPVELGGVREGEQRGGRGGFGGSVEVAHPVVDCLVGKIGTDRIVVRDRKSTRLNSSHGSISYA